MKIDQAELEEFTETLPEDIQDEYFRWLNTAYDIPTALFIIDRLKLKTDTLNVKAWAKVFGLDGEKEIEGATSYTINILNGVMDKDALQDKINPDIPIIVVEHTYGHGKKKGVSNLIIDGNKRLRKAFLEGREDINAYYLPAKLAKIVQVK